MFLPTKFAQNVFFGLPARGHVTFQLGVLQRAEDLRKLGTRAKSHSLEVVSRQQPFRADLLRRSRIQKPTDEFIGIQLAVAGKAIEAVQRQVFLKERKLYKSL